MPEPKRVSLLEAWMGYIYRGNICPAGQRALEFLRGCIARRIYTDEAIWNAAPDHIKAAFYTQFSRPTRSQQERKLEVTIDNLKEAINSATGAELPAALIKALRVQLTAKLKIQTNLIKKTGAYPTGTLHPGNTLASVTWTSKAKTGAK